MNQYQSALTIEAHRMLLHIRMYGALHVSQENQKFMNELIERGYVSFRGMDYMGVDLHVCSDKGVSYIQADFEAAMEWYS